MSMRTHMAFPLREAYVLLVCALTIYTFTQHANAM